MRYVTLLLVFFCLIVQVYSQSSDNYCVDVDYYNPKTGKQSSYRLDAQVDSGNLIKLNFPSGGYLDKNDFGNVLFNGETAIATIYGGETYKVRILNQSVDCFMDVAKARQCNGTTKKGGRCKNKTDNKSGYCWKHIP